MDTGLSLQVPGEAEGTGEKIDINVERWKILFNDWYLQISITENWYQSKTLTWRVQIQEMLSEHVA